MEQTINDMMASEQITRNTYEEELLHILTQKERCKQLLESLKGREQILLESHLAHIDEVEVNGVKIKKKGRNTPKINQKAFKAIYQDEYMKLAIDGELDVKIEHVKAVLPADEVDGVVTYTRSEWFEMLSDN